MHGHGATHFGKRPGAEVLSTDRRPAVLVLACLALPRPALRHKLLILLLDDRRPAHATLLESGLRDALPGCPTRQARVQPHMSFQPAPSPAPAAAAQAASELTPTATPIGTMLSGTRRRTFEISTKKTAYLRQHRGRRDARRGLGNRTENHGVLGSNPGPATSKSPANSG